MISASFEFDIGFQWDTNPCASRSNLIVGKLDDCSSRGYGLKFNKTVPLGFAFYRNTGRYKHTGFYVCILGVEVFAFKCNIK